MGRAADASTVLADNLERAADASQRIPGIAGVRGEARGSGSGAGGAGCTGGAGGAGGQGGGGGSTGPIAEMSETLKAILRVQQTMAFSWDKSVRGGSLRRASR